MEDKSVEERARYVFNLSPVMELGDAGSSSKGDVTLYKDIGGSAPKSCKIYFVTGHNRNSNQVIPASVSSLCGYSGSSGPPLMAGANQLSHHLPEPDQPWDDADARGRLSRFSSWSRATHSFSENAWE